MKLGGRLRKELAEKTSKKFIMQKIEEKLFIIVDDLNKGCKIEFKNFSLEERKEIVLALRDEELIVVGCDSEKKMNF